VILGGGAAAFAAITEASRQGLSTAMVNTGLPIGGTCVNVGCVPSKHLLAVAEHGAAASDNPSRRRHLHRGTDRRLDRSTRRDRRNRRAIPTGELRRRRRALRDRHLRRLRPTDRRHDHRGGRWPRQRDPNRRRKGSHRDRKFTGRHPLTALDDVEYYTSETILDERDLPESISIIGGGYIALEWGQILHRVGVDITILQRSDRILSGMEVQLGREIQRAFREEGIDIVTGNDFQQVQSAAADGGTEAIQQGVTVETTVDGDSRVFTAEALFVATGVQPNSQNIGLEALGVETEPDGAIRVDECFQTTNSDIYAAGDVIGEPELETVAAKEGNHVVKNAFGDEGATIDYNAVPAVVFTSPEVAAVGTTELEYMNEHGTCSCRTVQMEDVPRAKAVKNTDGLVQVVKHHETDEIVGVHMVAPPAPPT